MKNAIELAIEGGYKRGEVLMSEECYVCAYEHAFLDPLFWQALARNLGGDKLITQRIKIGMTVGILPTMLEGKLSSVEKSEVNVYVKGVGIQKHLPRSCIRLTGKSFTVWRALWTQFIDHLAEGKDADSFFTALLAPQGK